MKNKSTLTDAVAFLKAKMAAEAAQIPDNQEAAHEAAETPTEELAEHAPEGYEEGEQSSEALQSPDAELEKILAKLTPEELEQLVAHLSSSEQPEPAPDVSSLAQDIEGHLQQNPEASVESIDPEKTAALAFVKSAAYIEGFLTEAINTGATVKQAVDLYDEALTSTIQNIKSAELVGNQHKLDVDKDGKIEASDLKKLRARKGHEKNESPSTEMREHEVDSKTAAYYEGVLERAREYGIPDSATIDIVKKANDGEFSQQLLNLINSAKDSGLSAINSAGDKLKDLGGAANSFIQKQNPLHLAGAGVAAGGLSAAAISSLLDARKREKHRLAMMQAAAQPK